MSGHGVFIAQMDSFHTQVPDATYMVHAYPPENWDAFISESYAFRGLAQAPSGLAAFRWHSDHQFGIRSVVVMLPLWAFGACGAIGLILVYVIRRFRRVWRSKRLRGFPIMVST
jgi:hypothetical protein